MEGDAARSESESEKPGTSSVLVFPMGGYGALPTLATGDRNMAALCRLRLLPTLSSQNLYSESAAKVSLRCLPGRYCRLTGTSHTVGNKHCRSNFDDVVTKRS